MTQISSACERGIRRDALNDSLPQIPQNQALIRLNQINPRTNLQRSFGNRSDRTYMEIQDEEGRSLINDSIANLGAVYGEVNQPSIALPIIPENTAAGNYKSKEDNLHRSSNT
jgi:hypothetical protein